MSTENFNTIMTILATFLAGAGMKPLYDFILKFAKIKSENKKDILDDKDEIIRKLEKRAELQDKKIEEQDRKIKVLTSLFVQSLILTREAVTSPKNKSSIIAKSDELLKKLEELDQII